MSDATSPLTPGTTFEHATTITVEDLFEQAGGAQPVSLHTDDRRDVIHSAECLGFCIAVKAALDVEEICQHERQDAAHLL